MNLEEKLSNLKIDDLELMALAIEKMDVGTYIMDVDTYELVYANQKTRDFMKETQNNQDVSGKTKCYELLLGRTDSCSICKKMQQVSAQADSSQFFNEQSNQYFDMKGAFFTYQGRRLRVEVVNDISNYVTMQNKLEEQISFEQTLVACANTLSIEENITLAINSILETLGTYYNSSSCCIFEQDGVEERVKYTYKWMKDKTFSVEDIEQTVSSSTIFGWYSRFENEGISYIDSSVPMWDESAYEYQIMKSKNVFSILAVPLLRDGKLFGWLSVDNATKKKSDATLLKTVSVFITDHLKKMKVAKELETLSIQDRLTGLYNRHYYESVIQQLEGQKDGAVGVIYVDINGLKVINDKYGHNFGDCYIVKCAEILKNHFQKNVYRIGGDEFVVLLTNLPRDEFYGIVKTLLTHMEEDEKVSISVGVSYSKYSCLIHENVKIADMDMLKNKELYYKKNHNLMFLENDIIELLKEQIENKM